MSGLAALSTRGLVAGYERDLPIVRGQDVPDNAVLLNATLADYTGKPTEIPKIGRAHV